MNKCHNCGKEFERLSQHWALSGECDYPEFTEHQKEIVVGLLMGDGNIVEQGYNPWLRSHMISKNYLEYLDQEFGIISNGVELSMTAEENAEKKRNSNFSINADAENYSDVYSCRTRSHPELHEFNNWYNSGEKVWPENINLTPTVLKHWYCGDGTWNNSGSHSNIRIAMGNESENLQKVDEFFEDAGLPKPSNYNTCTRDNGRIDCAAVFTKEQSIELWRYMGEPLPDFEYKWPDHLR